ncbi:MAG: radical SAM protein [Lachnospiraceae bacterium]|nr:radical SAM protein [Lachnospiraceae bacterium]
MVINKINTKSYLTKSNLPASDFVINPYVGCPHSCKYCYACFMKRFSGHQEKWGEFVDIKICGTPLNTKKIIGKTVFMSSVTDCYNYLEEEHQLTRKILEQLVDIDFTLNISTKSKLICRDIDLLKKFKDLKVSISINCTDEGFVSDMEKASSVSERIEALRELHEAGIFTVLFISPIFPEITDYREIIKKTKPYVAEYWFENLNLRGSYKKDILSYIETNYPELYPLYCSLYLKTTMNSNNNYWPLLEADIEKYCAENKISYKNYFYHDKLVENKLKRK